jgi:hypothetical protein
MTRLGLLGAAALTAMATVGLAPTATVEPVSRTTATVQTTSTTQQQQRQQGPERIAIHRREDAIDFGRIARLLALPTEHKNRGPGERAHRRWRKARSSGRR